MDVLYGKKLKRNVSATVTSLDLKEEPNFNVGTLTQLQMPKETVVKLPQVKVNALIINFDKPIVVQLVVNLNAKDLKCNEQGEMVIPEIKVEVTININ